MAIVPTARIDRIGLGDKTVPGKAAPQVKIIKMNDSRKESKAISVNFDSQVFSLMAIKKAAYKYIDAFAADITIENHEIRCVLSLTSPRTEESSARLVDDFKKEVLDQDLREKLKDETEAVRNLVLAHAFSKTGIVNNERVSND